MLDRYDNEIDGTPCRNCGSPLGWHRVAQRWIHAATGHRWCFDDRDGYNQPSATPPPAKRAAAGVRSEH